MKLLLNLREALRALRANALRSVLTTLGIIFGVASVTVMIAIGAGTQKRIQEDIETLGTNTLQVHPGSAMSSGVRLARGARATLTDDDARAILSEVQDLVAAAPLVRGRVHAVFSNANWSTNVWGVTNQFFTARDWHPATGRKFAEEEIEAGRKVALVGRTVADRLFKDTDPVDQSIRIDRLTFRVIGVLQTKGQTIEGADLDDMIVVPLNTARNYLLGRALGSARAVTSVVVKASEDAVLPSVESEIRQVLRQRHGLADGKEDDFRVQNMAEY
ncbi:MAG: ABC transporter permease, partial [Gammaproteobacteria bacterium]|nr:ABC transporter permease [Gammaproteobacteria bacterium]